MGEPESRTVQELSIPQPEGNVVHKAKKFRVEDCFIVRQFQRNVNGEKDELIHKQEAVCRICFQMLGEVDSVMKTKCECEFTLIHTMCATQWVVLTCGGCKKTMQTIPVILLDLIRTTRPTTNSDQEERRHGSTRQRDRFHVMLLGPIFSCTIISLH